MILVYVAKSDTKEDEKSITINLHQKRFSSSPALRRTCLSLSFHEYAFERVQGEASIDGCEEERLNHSN
jgi:hypothetical protein